MTTQHRPHPSGQNKRNEPRYESVYHDALLQIYRYSAQEGQDGGVMDSRSRELVEQIAGVEGGYAIGANIEQCRRVYQTLYAEFRGKFPNGRDMPAPHLLDARHNAHRRAQARQQVEALPRAAQLQFPTDPPVPTGAAVVHAAAHLATRNNEIVEHNRSTLGSLYRQLRKQSSDTGFAMMALCRCGRIVPLQSGQVGRACACGAYYRQYEQPQTRAIFMGDTPNAPTVVTVPLA